MYAIGTTNAAYQRFFSNKLECLRHFNPNLVNAGKLDRSALAKGYYLNLLANRIQV
jgi:hypothetical protein